MNHIKIIRIHNVILKIDQDSKSYQLSRLVSVWKINNLEASLILEIN